MSLSKNWWYFHVLLVSFCYQRHATVMAGELEHVSTFVNTDVLTVGAGFRATTGPNSSAPFVDFEVTGLNNDLVLHALLIYHGSPSVVDDAQLSSPNTTVQLDGHILKSEFMAGGDDAGCDDVDPKTSELYLVDVTDVVHAKGDGTYRFLPHLPPPEFNANGASLLVVYDDLDVSNNRDYVLYLGSDSNFDERGWSLTLPNFECPALCPVIMQLHVAGGQEALDDKITVNGASLTLEGEVFSGDSVQPYPVRQVCCYSSCFHLEKIRRLAHPNVSFSFTCSRTSWGT